MKAMSIEEFNDGLGNDVTDFVNDTMDAGSIAELFETGSFTFDTPMGKLEFALTITKVE